MHLQLIRKIGQVTSHGILRLMISDSMYLASHATDQINEKYELFYSHFYICCCKGFELHTRNILRRRKHPQFQQMAQCYCVMCNSLAEETREHLFFLCPFARCLQVLGIQWDVTQEFNQMIITAKQAFQHGFFMEIFIIASWGVWKLSNGKIFEDESPSMNVWIVKFREQVLHLHRVKEEVRPSVVTWLSSVV